MKQSLEEIADLAEDLGNRYLSKGKVNLEKIAKSNRISFIRSNYGNHFLGQLVHLSKKFYIVLNSDLLSHTESGRIRFTIAHELGHFFIDGHRTNLAKGISLSFNGDLSDLQGKKIEVAANLFAANLLMPKTYFIKQAQKLEPGLACIYVLKKKFETSIESTTKHYINLNLSPSIMIKWRADFTFHYASYTNSFSKLTGIKGAPPIRFDADYVRDQIKTVDTTKGDYIESATPLSRWISTITPRSAKDLTGLEQTIKLGDYGGITLLTFL